DDPIRVLGGILGLGEIHVVLPFRIGILAISLAGRAVTALALRRKELFPGRDRGVRGRHRAFFTRRSRRQDPAAALSRGRYWPYGRADREKPDRDRPRPYPFHPHLDLPLWCRRIDHSASLLESARHRAMKGE